MNKVEKHAQICKSLNELYARKNADYGDSFGKSFDEYGLTMACIRLEDKLNRIKSLTKQAAQVSDESIVDTLMDLANYSIMTLVELAQGTSEENVEHRQGKHCESCVNGIFPDCQCLTCARDHWHIEDERGLLYGASQILFRIVSRLCGGEILMDNMRHIHLKEPDLKVNLERNTFEMVNRVHAEVINMQETAIVQACIRTAQRFGITDLFLIDEKFVKDALIEKIEREKLVHCKDCKNRGSTYRCPMRSLVFPFEGAGHCVDYTVDDGYCHCGERKEENHDQG